MARANGWVKFPKALLANGSLSANARLVYVYLVGAQYGKSNARVIATARQVGDGTAMSVRSAKRALAELSAAGFITNLNKGCHGRPANWLIREPEAVVIPELVDTPSAKLSVTSTSGSAKLGTTLEPSSTKSGIPLKKLFKESINTPRDAEIEEAVMLFNETAKRLGLPPVLKLTKGRKSRIAARLKDLGGIEGWRCLLDMVAKSPFLLGGGKRGWKASIDFIVKEQSLHQDHGRCVCQ